MASISSVSPDLLPIWSQCCHLLDQYHNLVAAYLTHAVATYRTSAKLLSVLLLIFSELASKGFCVPSAYSDEAQGEGATQFEDIENGGLGEGQGAKDVSDQIESQDQLEDAHKAGEEKDKENQDDQPDIKAEDNAIEMDDDMDGKLQDLQPQGKEEDGLLRRKMKTSLQN